MNQMSNTLTQKHFTGLSPWSGFAKNLTNQDMYHQRAKANNPTVKLVGCTDYNTGKSIPDSETELHILIGIKSIKCESIKCESKKCKSKKCKSKKCKSTKCKTCNICGNRKRTNMIKMDCCGQEVCLDCITRNIKAGLCPEENEFYSDRGCMFCRAKYCRKTMKAIYALGDGPRSKRTLKALRKLYYGQDAFNQVCQDQVCQDKTDNYNYISPEFREFVAKAAAANPYK